MESEASKEVSRAWTESDGFDDDEEEGEEDGDEEEEGDEDGDEEEGLG